MASDAETESLVKEHDSEAQTLFSKNPGNKYETIVFFIILWTLTSRQNTDCTTSDFSGPAEKVNVEYENVISGDEITGDLDKDLGKIVQETEYELEGDGEGEAIDTEVPSSGEAEVQNGDGEIETTEEKTTSNEIENSVKDSNIDQENMTPHDVARAHNCASGICGNHQQDARDIVIKEQHNSEEMIHSAAVSKLSMFDDDIGRERLKVFIHVPKTAGSSIVRDGVKKLSHVLKGNFERSFYRLREEDAVMLGFFRQPRPHVFSQFMHCKYNPYGTHRNYTGFVKTTKDEEGDAHDFEAWLDHFNSPNFEMVDLDRRAVSLKDTAWDCYNPINMQARYMTSHCHNSHECHQGTSADPFEPSIVEAIQNLEKMDWFGLTEYYKPSLCMLFYQSKGHLPEFCKCEEESHKKLNHVNHHIKSHDVNRLNLRIKRKIDHITRIDQQLYNHAKDIFMARIVELERLTGFDVICDK